MKNNQEHNHVLKGVPNTKENRDKIAEFNKMAKESNSMHRIRMKYRKPKNGYRNKYADGCVPKEDASCFSIYLRKTAKQERLDNEQQRERWKRETDYRHKYRTLQSKYNSIMLKPILQGLADNIEELQHALDKGNNWWSIVNSLNGVVKGVDEDITNDLEV